MQLRIHARPIVALQRTAHPRIQLMQPVQHPALQLRQIIERHSLGIRPAIEAAEQPAQCIAQPPVQLGLLLQDLRPDAEVLAHIAIDDP